MRRILFYFEGTIPVEVEICFSTLLIRFIRIIGCFRTSGYNCGQFQKNFLKSFLSETNNDGKKGKQPTCSHNRFGFT